MPLVGLVIAYLEMLCPQLTGSPRIVINCSGRGDKDVQTVAKFLDSL
jgi:tryptophan synthase beta chain